MNLANELIEISKKLKDKDSIITRDRSISYLELSDRIDVLADAFQKIGIKEADKVAIILPNTVEFVISFFALNKINATAVLIEPVYNIREFKEIFDGIPSEAVISNSDITLKVLSNEESLLNNKKFITIDNNPRIKNKYPNHS